jgi:hypothetical protein
MRSANIVGEGGNVKVSCYSSPPAARGSPPRFIGQGEACTVMPHGSSATYGGMAHSVVELMVVLENLASGGRRGESRACQEATSRVAAWELLVRSPSVCRLEGWDDGRPGAAQQQAWWCPVVMGSHSIGDDAAVPGMAAQRRGWRHNAGDGCTGPEATEETCSAGLTSWRRSGRARGRWSYPF